jgi:hypothetical protein
LCGVTVSSNTKDPTQTSQQTALTGITSTLTGSANAVNTNGSQLTAAEIMPFLATNLWNDSLDQAQYAAALATSPPSGALSSYPPGVPLPVTRTLPKTFANRQRWRHRRKPPP